MTLLIFFGHPTPGGTDQKLLPKPRAPAFASHSHQLGVVVMDHHSNMHQRDSPNTWSLQSNSQVVQPILGGGWGKHVPQTQEKLGGGVALRFLMGFLPKKNDVI